MSREEVEKARFLYDFVSKLELSVEKASERTYKKIHDFMTVASAGIPVALGFGYFVLTTKQASVILLLLSFSIVLFILGLIKGLLLLRYGLFTYIDPAYMIETYHEDDLVFIVNKIASTSAGAVNRNIETINDKSKGKDWILFFTCTGLILLSSSFFLVVVLTQL